MPISFVAPKAKIEFKGDKILLFLAGMILFLLLIFIGLKIYNIQLKGEISTVQGEIKKLDEQRNKDLEEAMAKKAPLLKKGKIVLDSHTRLKNILDLFEKKTFNEVQITNFIFDAKDNSVIISAESLSDIALAMQASIFRSASEIKSIEIGGISKGGEVFKFQFKLILDEKVIRFSKE